MKKTALVTGSSTGIGRATALELARNGYDVVVHYSSSREKASEVADQIRVMGQTAWLMQADFNNVDDVKHLAKECLEQAGKIDLLVNNAGIVLAGHLHSFLDTPEDFYDRLHAIDLKAVFVLTQLIGKAMVDQGIAGNIINICSINAHSNLPIRSSYAAIKAALLKLTKHQAMELAKYGIRVNSISPGLIKVRNLDHFTEYEERMIRNTPLKRIGYPADIANAVVFLASEEASFITGADLKVDGGASLHAGWDNDI